MKRHGLYWRAWTFGAALLLVPALGLAQSPHEGIYLGAFQGTSDDGEFALIVDDRGHGILAAYDAVDDWGYTEFNIFIRPDGSFRFITRQGVHIEGLVSGSGVVGRYSGAGEGSFNGWRTPDEGPLREAAGYYSGSAAISGDGVADGITTNSRVVSIIAADGSAFFLLDRAVPRFPRFQGYWPGSVGFSFGLDLGLGIDLDTSFDTRSPPCGLHQPWQARGWPFNIGLDYSFGLSVLGIVDLDFSFSLNPPSCAPAWTWPHALTSAVDSGGIVLIGEDGEIQARLLDGLTLQGSLDIAAATAEGVLYQDAYDSDWFGHWTIERRGGGKSMENAVQFHQLPDLNGDGLADIPWQHTVAGAQALWLMDGPVITAEIPLEVHPGLDWKATSPVLPGEGRGADLAWRDPATGETFAWLRDEAAPIRFEPDPSHLLAGVGDFDGDGSADVLWRDLAAGAVRITLRPGRHDAETVLLDKAVNRQWQIAAVGDLDGDGSDDIVWREAWTGENTAWFISAARLKGAAPLMPVADPHWVIRP